MSNITIKFKNNEIIVYEIFVTKITYDDKGQLSEDTEIKCIEIINKFIKNFIDDIDKSFTISFDYKNEFYKIYNKNYTSIVTKFLRFTKTKNPYFIVLEIFILGKRKEFNDYIGYSYQFRFLNDYVLKFCISYFEMLFSLNSINQYQYTRSQNMNFIDEIIFANLSITNKYNTIRNICFCTNYKKYGIEFLNVLLSDLIISNLPLINNHQCQKTTIPFHQYEIGRSVNNEFSLLENKEILTRTVQKYLSFEYFLQANEKLKSNIEFIIHKYASNIDMFPISEEKIIYYYQLYMIIPLKFHILKESHNIYKNQDLGLSLIWKKFIELDIDDIEYELEEVVFHCNSIIILVKEYLTFLKNFWLKHFNNYDCIQILNNLGEREITLLNHDENKVDQIDELFYRLNNPRLLRASKNEKISLCHNYRQLFTTLNLKENIYNFKTRKIVKLLINKTSDYLFRVCI